MESGNAYRLILVWIRTNRGQREAVRLVQPERRGGRHAGEGSLTVRGQVERRRPGGAVVQAALYDEVAGTGTLCGGQIRRGAVQIGSKTARKDVGKTKGRRRRGTLKLRARL